MNPNDVPLKDYIEKQIAALEKAVEKAERQLDTRMLVTKAEYNIAHDFLVASIRKVELDAANREGQAKQMAIIAAIVASIIVGVISTVVGHWLVK